MKSSEKTMIDPQKLLGLKFKSAESSVEAKDAVLYALGIGFSKDPLEEKDLKFTYELKDYFSVFPTYSTCLPKFDLLNSLNTFLPNFNSLMALHGEHKIELYRSIIPGAKLITEAKVANIADKGSGALLTFELSTYEVKDGGKKELLFINYHNGFLRGLGGFGFKGIATAPFPNPPKKAPCKVLEDKTLPGQAIIYRLSGDFNPLHIDPKLKMVTGFDRPILHGLCTFGICAKLICQAWLNNDQSKIKSVQARFTSHVFPGETLKVATWKEGNLIIFSGETAERKLECIRGAVEIAEGVSPKL
jgi:acyl dehydratase